MTRLFKLTKSNDRTYGGMQWGEGVEHTASGEGGLCSSGWLHAYEDPLLAIFLNPAHAWFDEPHLWEADGDVGATDYGLKVGCTRLRTLRQIPPPNVTLPQRIRFAILCAQKICDDPAWNTWANQWLSEMDRSRNSALNARIGLKSDAASEAAISAAFMSKGRSWVILAAAWSVLYTVWETPQQRRSLLNFAALAKQAIAEEKN